MFSFWAGIALATRALPSPGALYDLPPCLAATLSPLLSSATEAPTDPFALKMAAASAKAIGETGDYLACIRLVNGTQFVASYTLVQFLASQQGPASQVALFFGACLPRHCADVDLRHEFEHDLPRAFNATKVSILKRRGSLTLTLTLIPTPALTLTLTP